MTAHKFKAGQSVTVAVRRFEASRGGRFHIVRILPTEHGVKQYRIRSDVDGHERVVSEAELVFEPQVGRTAARFMPIQS